MNRLAIPWPSQEVTDFCRRWRIIELALFGSVLRDDFQPDSDVDVLVTFAPNASWSLLDHIQMEQELSAILGRGVDLVSKRAVERSANWIRRQAILGSAEVVYVAG
jgi:predicted nucleotidyltransferase